MNVKYSFEVWITIYVKMVHSSGMAWESGWFLTSLYCETQHQTIHNFKWKNIDDLLFWLHWSCFSSVSESLCHWSKDVFIQICLEHTICKAMGCLLWVFQMSKRCFLFSRIVQPYFTQILSLLLTQDIRN